jgi:hypothetical protein
VLSTFLGVLPTFLSTFFGGVTDIFFSSTFLGSLPIFFPSTFFWKCYQHFFVNIFRSVDNIFSEVCQHFFSSTFFGSVTNIFSLTFFRSVGNIFSRQNFSEVLPTFFPVNILRDQHFLFNISLLLQHLQKCFNIFNKCWFHQLFLSTFF